MTGQEMERAIEFLLQNQATLEERVEQTQAQLAELSRAMQMQADSQGQFNQMVTTAITSLTETQLKTEAKVGRLAEQGAQTNARIDQLVEQSAQTNSRIEQLAEQGAQANTRIDRLADVVGQLVERLAGGQG